jgi:hypothetical protein
MTMNACISRRFGIALGVLLGQLWVAQVQTSDYDAGRARWRGPSTRVRSPALRQGRLLPPDPEGGAFFGGFFPFAVRTRKKMKRRLVRRHSRAVSF